MLRSRLLNFEIHNGMCGVLYTVSTNAIMEQDYWNQTTANNSKKKKICWHLQ